MRLLKHSYDAPAENLALDEALLDEAEAGREDETLRFWTSPIHFVVLGLSQVADEHVIREVCARDRVPILRRCSAGGCVLQGPGCLNYSLVLRTDRPGCETIHSSYRTILSSVSQALGRLGHQAEPAGTSDLAINGRKVSGSAQRRRRRYFLHHGTLLIGFDLALCGKYLREPAEQPKYRAKRLHESFVANISTEESLAVRTVSSVFQSNEIAPLSRSTEQAAQGLAQGKYSRHDWIFRK